MTARRWAAIQARRSSTSQPARRSHCISPAPTSSIIMPCRGLLSVTISGGGPGTKRRSRSTRAAMAGATWRKWRCHSTAASATLPAASASITLPLTITVSIGIPVAADTTAGAQVAAESTDPDAVRRFAAAHKGRHHQRPSGLVIKSGQFTDMLCIHVVTHPEKVAAVRARCPATFLGHPVDVRAAAIVEMIGGQDFVSEAAVTSISYDDNARTGPEFSFDPVDEDMEVLCCVGPERSWKVRRDFMSTAKGRAGVVDVRVPRRAHRRRHRISTVGSDVALVDGAGRRKAAITKTATSRGVTSTASTVPLAGRTKLTKFERVFVPLVRRPGGRCPITSRSPSRTTRGSGCRAATGRTRASRISRGGSHNPAKITAKTATASGTS